MTKRTILLIVLLIPIVILASFLVGAFAYISSQDRTVFRVVSQSMVPTLNEGDLIIVQGGLDATAIVVGENTGDIIAFHRPGDPNEIVTHRAINKFLDGDLWKFETKGDHNTHVDLWSVFETDIVGRVVEINSFPVFVLSMTFPLLIAIGGLILCWILVFVLFRPK